MPDIFSNLQTGIRKPDVIMNSGPLPGTNSLPNGFNGTTDAKINYGSALLGDISPYEYGPPNRLANQTAYMNVPHKVQKLVPLLRLPEARIGTQTFSLSHAVDDGDISFSLRVARNAGTIEGMHTFERLGVSNMVDPCINLTTVNYLLAGVQRNWNRPDQIKWHQFIVDTDFMPPSIQAHGAFTVRNALHFIQEIARPFGVAHGSEKQGGQHEGSHHPVVFPVNFMTSLAVSGKIDNLINYWRDFDVSAGDDLILHLAWRPISKPDNSLEYVLNHWHKGIVRQRFEFEHAPVNGTDPVNFGWQLVPAVYNTYAPEQTVEDFDWRQHGYWHICRTQIMKGRENTSKLERTQKVQPCYYDDSRFLRGSLLEVNFEPVFIRMRRLQRLALAQPRGPYHRQGPPPPQAANGPQRGDGGGGGGGGGDGHPPPPPHGEIAGPPDRAAIRRRIRRVPALVPGAPADGDGGGDGGGGGPAAAGGP